MQDRTEYRLRTPPELAAELRALRDHLRTLDSASPEAALMDDAATYIEGATESLREHMAMCRQMRDALRRIIQECGRARGDQGHRDASRFAFATAYKAAGEGVADG